ncbi:MAG: hypothetical protein CENE_03707 [Candidatus Celerinatantimonas neptuna]|nr:MAG: hypothetical protein CENE_03707 [Candidatus Celerinatantimonas neptuna]
MNANRHLKWVLVRKNFLVQWRSGMLGLMSYAIVLSVFCIVLGRWVDMSLNHQFNQQNSALFGSDRAIVSSAPLRLPDSVKHLPLKISRSVMFHTMAYSRDRMQLLRIRATDNYFPLQGSWQRQPLQSLRAGEVWLDASAMQLLGVHIGSKIALGDGEFVIAGESVSEPAGGAQAFWFVPKAVISLKSLASTKAVGPGSRLQYIVNISADKKTLKELDSLSGQFPDTWQYRIAGQISTRTSEWLKDARYLIGLASALIVLLCLYTLLVAMRGYLQSMRRQLKTVYLLGASRRQIRHLMLFPLLMAFVPATLVGIGLAVFVFQAGHLAGISWLKWHLEYGLVIFWGFVPLLIGLLMVIVALCSIHSTQSLMRRWDQVLSGWPMISVWFLACILVLARLLGEWSWVLILSVSLLICLILVRWFRRAFLIIMSCVIHGRIWRLAMLQFKRSGQAVDSVILGLTLSLGLTGVLWGLQHQLLNQWIKDLPSDTPNYFLVNLQPSSVGFLQAQAKKFNVTLSRPYSIVRGRITAVNHVSLCQKHCAKGVAKAVGRELNFTQSSALPVSNKIIAGKWFHMSLSGVSLEADFAKRIHARLGDKVTLTIYGSQLTLPVTSIRQVDWQSFQPNFFVIFSPGALNSFPGMVIASAYIPNHQEAFIQSVRQRDPGMSVVDIRQVLSMGQSLLKQLTTALQAISVLLVIAALLLLNVQLGISLFDRRQKLAVMRLMGATKQQLIRSLMVEFAILGFLSACLAILLSEVLLWQLGHWLSLSWSPGFDLWVSMILIAPVLVCVSVFRFIQRLFLSNRWQQWGAYG